MVNQWGRDGSFSSGTTRSGGGAILLAAIVALLIGGAGGYAGARYLSGVSSSDVKSRDERIAALEEKLSDMKFANADSETGQGVLRNRIEELEDQLAAANRTKESLRAEVAKADETARANVQAEIEALQKTLDEAGDLQGQLGRTRKSLKVSELQIIELEKTVGEYKAEIADLRAQLSDGSKDANGAARREIEKLKQELDTRQQQLNDALRTASEAGRRAKEIERLTKELDGSIAKLAERDADARDAAKDLTKAGATIEAQKQALGKLELENKALRESQQALTRQVEDLKAQLVKATPVVPSEDKQPVEPGMKPRDRDAVADAVEELPGFDKLTEARQEALIAMLERGECVTTSLKSAYGHVPAVALRNLMRDLGGRC